MNKEYELFQGFLGEQGLNLTSQRKAILETFLQCEKHLCADDLFAMVKKEHPEIGYATVHRTLKLIKEAGLAREVDFGERKKRFEHLFGHKHHDHLICTRCGQEIEFFAPQIEEQQAKIAQKYNFKETRHRLEIFGICRGCLSKKGGSE